MARARGIVGTGAIVERVDAKPGLPERAEVGGPVDDLIRQAGVRARIALLRRIL
jgi:hypothetical protein